MPINNTQVVNGSCEADAQSITLQWGQLSQMKLVFNMNVTAQQFMLSQINLNISASDVASDAKGKFVFVFKMKNLQLYN